MFDIKIAIKIKNDILMKIVNKERYIVNMVWNKVVEKKKCRLGQTNIIFTFNIVVDVDTNTAHLRIRRKIS